RVPLGGVIRRQGRSARRPDQQPHQGDDAQSLPHDGDPHDPAFWRMWGVITKITSLLVLSVDTLLNNQPRMGMSPSNGIFTVVLISFFWMSPASMMGVPSLTVSDESASRVAIVGGMFGPGGVLMVLTSGCILTVT